MLRDPFQDEKVPIKEAQIEPETPPQKKTRKRGHKIEVNGVIREVLELSKEETAEWFAARMPIYYEIIHELVTAKDTPKNVKVKVLELITKVTGQIVEKHEVTVINPEDIARRGIEAARELENFKIKLIEGNGNTNAGG